MPDRGPVNRVPERFAEGNSGLSVPEKGRQLEAVLLLKDDQLPSTEDWLTSPENLQFGPVRVRHTSHSDGSLQFWYLLGKCC